MVVRGNSISFVQWFPNNSNYQGKIQGFVKEVYLDL